MAIEMRIVKGKSVFETLVAKLKCLRQSRVEVWGTKGVDEHRSELWEPFGPTYCEKAVELMNKLEEEFPFVDNQNKNAFAERCMTYIKEAKAALPVDDKTHSVEEVKQRDEEQKKKEESRKIVEAEVKSHNEKIIAKKPSWASAYIIAEYEVDESRIEVDYFGSRSERQVVIGFRSGKREDFKQLRRAALGFEPTKDLDKDECEHRENYSMGRGNYLKNGGRYRTGWYVYSTESLSYGKYEDAIPEQPVEQAKEETSGMGCTIRPGTREGYVEIIFPAKPEPEVIGELKGHGFRFTCNGGQPRWYGRESSIPTKLKQ